VIHSQKSKKILTTQQVKLKI